MLLTSKTSPHADIKGDEHVFASWRLSDRPVSARFHVGSSKVRLAHFIPQPDPIVLLIQALVIRHAVLAVDPPGDVHVFGSVLVRMYHGCLDVRLQTVESNGAIDCDKKSSLPACHDEETRSGKNDAVALCT